MSAEGALEFRQAQQDYRMMLAEAELSGQNPADVSSEELVAAARAHLAESRPLEDISAEYDELQQARWEHGETVDFTRYQELADELAPVAEATQIAAGNLPGSGHSASAGIGSLDADD